MTVDADKPVPLAVIIGAHGVTGEVRLKLFCDSLDSLKPHKTFNVGKLTLKSVKPHKMGAIARFAEITNRNGAEAARGTELTVPRSALPALEEDEFYHIDIIGLRCVSDNGEELGKLFAIYEFGAGDVIEIERPSGKKFMVPAKAVDMRSDPAIVMAEFVESS
ncbi:ribosome maturation factor RimM [Parasphingorhabdus halotolerans]|uniref:Ribosome maturation factor RimM n=1 Tax=Parasphingorhabdus halotolerans TaxID=2725558 RepID=A0A6H2DRP6_9SPHN|nr:ribosome maturation factor RimM [Parasphingorhabdus halotolerans]QJB70625.1 16S rRNA processing protein RimM [Parasphingorhabdus halotolerans]